MNRLVFPVPLFQQTLQRLLRRPEEPLYAPVGVNRRTGSIELLAAVSSPPGNARLYLTLSTEMVVPIALPDDVAGLLLLGEGRHRGQARGFVCPSPGRLEPLHRLRLVGSGMHEIALEETGTDIERPRSAGDEARSALEWERWSRTVGALGREEWERMTALRCLVIGVGRTGSGMALALARYGQRSLTLLDPDRVEPGNLGEMQGVTAADIGRTKVEAISAALRALDLPHLEVTTLPISITRRAALEALRESDLVFCCADHDGARLAATALCTLFHRPLIDIATGIQRADDLAHPTSQSTMGADVRLMLPGRCLLCFGGLRDEAGARRVLASADAETAFYGQRDWRRERPGSLASLNLLATALALRLCEDLVAERVSESLWAHLAFEAGRLAVLYPTPTRREGDCPVCRLAGSGAEGLPLLMQTLQRENQSIRRRPALTP